MIILIMTLITFSMLVVFVLSSTHLLPIDNTYESKSSFECGFSSWRAARTAFSLRFFLLGVLFVIFDVELVILFPVVFISEGPMIIYFLPLIVFMIILALGLMHEMYQGALEWSDL